ncbi:hypothetical protein H4219_003752 [Mycoemilia scoparia]|uniref:Uncharacterized protein n=1 Tax=Mycoemilia scoparia TaxID=417184 RepID=A0A9W8DSX1_9FUNG|nr:hypothetical protein H4219_003752 [Mycoemilia scoparia]
MPRKTTPTSNRQSLYNYFTPKNDGRQKRLDSFFKPEAGNSCAKKDPKRALKEEEKSASNNSILISSSPELKVWTKSTPTVVIDRIKPKEGYIDLTHATSSDASRTNDRPMSFELNSEYDSDISLPETNIKPGIRGSVKPPSKVPSLEKLNLANSKLRSKLVASKEATPASVKNKEELILEYTDEETNDADVKGTDITDESSGDDSDGLVDPLMLFQSMIPASKKAKQNTKDGQYCDNIDNNETSGPSSLEILDNKNNGRSGESKKDKRWDKADSAPKTPSTPITGKIGRSTRSSKKAVLNSLESIIRTKQQRNINLNDLDKLLASISDTPKAADHSDDEQNKPNSRYNRDQIIDSVFEHSHQTDELREQASTE